MSRLHSRRLIAPAAVAAALLSFSSRAADAQNVPAGPSHQCGATPAASGPGVLYDVLSQQKGERRLAYYQAKVAQDSCRGDRDAVDRDLRRIEKNRYRIAVTGWLIRKNTFQDPGYYPVRPGDLILEQ